MVHHLIINPNFRFLPKKCELCRPFCVERSRVRNFVIPNKICSPVRIGDFICSCIKSSSEVTPFLRIDFSALNLPYRKPTFLSPPSLRDTSPYHKGRLSIFSSLVQWELACAARLRDCPVWVPDGTKFVVSTLPPAFWQNRHLPYFSASRRRRFACVARKSFAERR